MSWSRPPTPAAMTSSLTSSPVRHPTAATPNAESPSRVLYARPRRRRSRVPITRPTEGVDPYVATRGENGWTTEYVGVPANNPFAAEPFSSIPSGADAQLETLAFGGPEGCSPCFAGGYTGIPVHLPDGELDPGHGGPDQPGPHCQIRRPHRQGPLRQRRTLHLRLDLALRPKAATMKAATSRSMTTT